mmetsp:Transcript_46399/g.129347  ORF Transcript_46399/g.129347 Transcript_46399/m.129347 type:complete len:82 (+) Transcript_46399:1-246(+)
MDAAQRVPPTRMWVLLVLHVGHSNSERVRRLTSRGSTRSRAEQRRHERIEAGSVGPEQRARTALIQRMPRPALLALLSLLD